jgi:hypothetical protein
MANVLNSNPWSIDTVTAGSLCPGQTVHLKTIRWIGAGTAGDVAELQDDGGNVIWRSVASGPNFVEAELIENTVNLGRGVGGLRASVLTSGRLLITYM